jgi:phospholipase/carboxylesterase
LNPRVFTAGAPLQRAKAAVLLLHGRGASAESMLVLANSLTVADVAYFAPQAPGSSWYPYSFLAPLQQNEPSLSNALATVTNSVAHVSAHGMNPESIVILGFSQGGCLALEYAARHPRRLGGVVGLSAGLIGPVAATRHDVGSLSGTPIFIGCSDEDAHIPLSRVHESTAIFTDLGGAVTERIYPGLGHTINADELLHVERMLDGLVRGRTGQREGADQ